MPRKRLQNPKKHLAVDPITAAELLEVSPSSVYRWLQQGRLPGYRVGVSWRIRVKDVADVLEIREEEVLAML